MAKAVINSQPYEFEEGVSVLEAARTLGVNIFNAGTMTMRTPNARFRATDFLDISKEDADRLQLHNGECVRVRSRYGEAALPVRITSSVKPGELFATFHTLEASLKFSSGSVREDTRIQSHCCTNRKAD